MVLLKTKTSAELTVAVVNCFSIWNIGEILM